jgi:UDP-glucose 4-epimerase
VIHTAIVQIPLINEQKRLGYEVNVIGTQNVCRAVEENPGIKGMILAGSWHTIGERGIVGMVDEEFGFRPDKVEDRARLYALSKVAQESIVRIYDEMSCKTFGVIRMGTVLGEGMPESTAASLFIERGIKGEPITPFAHSMYRPMLYVDIEDVCKAYEVYASKILNAEHRENGNSLAHIVNVYYPRPVTILRLAEIVKDAISSCSQKRTVPTIEIVDKRLPVSFDVKDIEKIQIDISKARDYLGIERFRSPEVSIRRIVKKKLKNLL